MADFLSRMVETSRVRVADDKRKDPDASVWRRAMSKPSPPTLRFSPDRFDVIAEYKRCAPSTGRLSTESNRQASLSKQISAYAMGGAVAVSVLTEPTEFSGSLADLSTAAKATRLPVMRKDFIVDPYQVFQARATGAGGILVIPRILDDSCLRDVMLAVAETGLFLLLETFDLNDLSRALVVAEKARDLGVKPLVGVNARNLQTLTTERSRFRQLRKRIPSQFPRIAESCLHTPEHAAEVARCGYDLALVGSALMRTPDPARLLSAMIAAGRMEKVSQCAFA